MTLVNSSNTGNRATLVIEDLVSQRILFRTSWDRAPPRQPRTSADGSFAGPSSDENARSCGQGKHKPYVFCQTPQSIFQVPVLSPWTGRIGPEAFSVCARPRWLGELCRWQTPRP